MANKNRCNWTTETLEDIRQKTGRQQTGRKQTGLKQSSRQQTGLKQTGLKQTGRQQTVDDRNKSVLSENAALQMFLRPIGSRFVC